MARVARKRIVIAGPNYVGPGRKSADRLQPLWRRLVGCLLGRHRRLHRLSPHLSLDEEWETDADAVSAVNVWWVARELRRQGFCSVSWCTRGGVPQGRWWKLIPFHRLVGFLMFVVADRKSAEE